MRKQRLINPLNRIDLNSDVGESFGNYTLGLDAEVIPHISSANIACGYHAGDPAVMRKTVSLAKAHGVALGAHPGLPDLVGFGRRNMDVTIEEIKDFVTVQIGALQAVAALQGARLQHVKPHGALYNMAVKNPAIWDAVAEVMAALDPRLILFVLAGSDRGELEEIGRRRGIRIAFEFFADRAYDHHSYQRQLRQRGIKPIIAHRNTANGSGLGRVRWVVERTFAWLHQFKRLLVRYDRRDDIHEAFLGLACCLICFRQLRSAL